MAPRQRARLDHRPLDGTTNFIHGLPTYASSIALAVQPGAAGRRLRPGATTCSMRPGPRRYLNDRRLRVSQTCARGWPSRWSAPAFPSAGDNFKRYLKIFEEVMPNCARLRRRSAAALDLCYVAAGWYDGFFETGLQPWDVAAGSLMVSEAGGLIGNFTGEADFGTAARGGRRQPEDLRPAGAAAGAALHVIAAPAPEEGGASARPASRGRSKAAVRVR